MLNLLAQIELEYPARLVGLVLLPLLAYFAWRSRTGQLPRQRLTSLLCRGLAVALLVIALAGVTHRSESRQRMVVLAVDVSRSVQGAGQAATSYVAAADAARGPHRVVVLPFADRPGELDFGRLQPGGLEPLISDPAAALRTAAAAIPADYVPQIVLLTDGLETQGDMAAAALGAGGPVDVVLLEPFRDPEACLSELFVRHLDAIAGQVTLEAVVVSNHEGPAQLQIDRQGQVIAEQGGAVVQGENRFRFSVPLGDADSSLFQASLSAAWDTIPENNRRRARVVAPPRPRVLLVEPQPQPAGPLARALGGDRAALDIRSPDQLPADAAALEDYALIVLSNVAPDQLPPAATAALTQYVHDRGGGLIAAGGEQTYGATLYRGSALERLLPVTAAEVIESKPPVLALLLVIDRSGSMVEENRLELAKEAARQSVQLLEPHDQAGVMAFSDAPLWVADIAPVADRNRLLEQIGTLTPGGQTNMYQAVEWAFLALEQTDADRRYMILLTDGIPSPGDYREIAQRMADREITLSTVSISPGAEQDLLIEMARIAGGRHYHCDDPADVPAILVQETRAAASDDRAESFTPLVLRALPGLDVSSAPPLAAYALTNPKPEAEQLLMAAGRDPLLAWWRYGAGTAVALTCQADSPAMQAWQARPEHAAFWQRLIRHTARRADPPPVRWDAGRDGLWATVSADFGTGSLSRAATDPPQLTLHTPDGQPHAVPGKPVAPGRYQIRFPAADTGEYRVEGRQDDPAGSAAASSFSLLIDYPVELQLQAGDEPALRAIALATGGRYNPQAHELFAPDDRTVARTTAVWRPLLLAAMLLFLVDIAIRRLRL